MDPDHANQLQRYYERVVDVYDSSYTGIGRYRSNYFRLRILIALLERLSDQPSNILDAGCGDGRPLAEMLRLGFNVHGFDISHAMLEAGRKVLSNANQDPSRIRQGDVYKIPASDNSYDAITCMGVVENLPHHDRIFAEFGRVLQPKGRLFISLENDLFSLFSINKHSIKFIGKLLTDIGVPDDIKAKVVSDIARWNDVDSIRSIKRTFEDAEIDKTRIVIPSYNPMNVCGELKKFGFDVEELRFFHFHPLPPRFEIEYPELFQGLAERLETVEYDWRGGILCNCMVVQAQAP